MGHTWDVLGYFGPKGTFTHQALRTVSEDEAVAFGSVRAALDAVRKGEVAASVVPIENSVEGGVSATLDELIAGAPLTIKREIVIPVEFGLYVRDGLKMAEIRNVLTHGHAAAQCREWLATHLPHAAITEAGSTAGAAAEVSRPDSRYDAAVSARVAGRLYGLTELAYQIEDNPGAVTRFVLVGRPGALPESTGSDKTTLVAYMRKDHSGALLEILQQFAVRGVNLSRLESRPTKTTLGSYCFSIDAEGHIADRRVLEALEGLHRVCAKVHFLGSYPRADQIRPEIGIGFSDDEFAAATEWARGLDAL